MKRITALGSLFAFCMLSLFTSAQTKTLKSYTEVNSNIPGFYEYLPVSYHSQPNQRFPLIVFINGLGATGDGSPEKLIRVLENLWGSPADRSYRSPGYFYFPNSFTVFGRSFEFIIAAPQFRVDPWGTSTKDIGDFLDYMEQHYRVDKSRIYLTGQSSGGIFVLQFVGSSVENARRIAGVISASPAGELNQQQANNVAQGKVAVWLAAASEDPQYGSGGAVRYIRNTADRIKNAKPTYAPWLSVLETPGGSHGTAAYYIFNEKSTQDGFTPYEWLLFHSRQGTLAVNDLKVEAKRLGSSVAVDWSTTCEMYSSTYTVEMGTDGVRFNDLVSQTSKNSPLGSSYSYTLSNLDDGTYFFRVRHMDFDGALSYSNTIKFHYSSNNNSAVRVFPNPTTDILVIEGKAVKNASKIRIFDSAGKLFKEINITSGETLNVSVSSFPAGVYYGQLIGEEREDFTFIKK